MSWVKQSDDWYDDPRFVRVGPLGAALHFAAVAWCNRNRKDGVIPRARARMLIDLEGLADVDDVIKRLLVEMWEESEEGYVLVGYLEEQRSADQIRARSLEVHEAKVRAGKTRAEGPRDSNGKFVGSPSSEPAEPPDSPAEPPPHDDQTASSPPTSDPAKTKDLRFKTPKASDDETCAPPAAHVAEFEQFWAVYPLRKAKVAARTAFDKARKRAELDEILAGVERYIDDLRGRDIATAHPATWLKQERWLDEPTPARVPVARGSPRGDARSALFDEIEEMMG